MFLCNKKLRLGSHCGEAKAEKVLDHLCEKALLVDSEYNGVRKFVMPPPMAGFIEFALMRTRGDIDQKYLSELYYQYMNVEEDFVKDLFYATETKLGRVFVQEPVLTNAHMNHILDYERASHIVDEAEYIGLGLCYCRHKAYHAGHPCEIDAPRAFDQASFPRIKKSRCRQPAPGPQKERSTETMPG